MLYTSSQALITVNFTGVTIDSEPWELWEDGQKKAEGLKAFPGGMKDGIELGSTPTREPLKLGRKWCDPLITAYKSLEALVGFGPMEASRTTLNASKQPVGSPITLSGIVLEIGQVMYKAGPSEELTLLADYGPRRRPRLSRRRILVGNPVSPPDAPYTYEDLLSDRDVKLTVLGPDCCFQWITGSAASPKGGQRVGIIFWHRANDGRACGGYVNFDPDMDRPSWTVESTEPLTISPSVLCDGGHGCGGYHGFIRAGAWVPA